MQEQRTAILVANRFNLDQRFVQMDVIENAELADSQFPFRVTVHTPGNQHSDLKPARSATSSDDIWPHQRQKSSSERPMVIGRGGRANRQQPMVADGIPAAHGRRSTPHDPWATAGNQRPGTSGRQSAVNDKRPTATASGWRVNADGRRQVIGPTTTTSLTRGALLVRRWLASASGY